jgi:signal transduction histidine kinase
MQSREAQPPWSMQTQLIAIALAITILAWFAGVTVMANVSQREAEKLHDQKLKEVAALLLGLSGHEIEEIGANTPIEARIVNGRADSKEALGDDYRYQVWSSDGHLLLTNFGIASTGPMARMGQTAFSWLQMDGEKWRVYSLHSPESKQEIEVAERAALRVWKFGPWDGRLLLLVVVSLLVVLVPGLLLLRRLLRPLRVIAQDLRTRSPMRLEPMRVDHAPRELTPVVSALNALFVRVSAAIRRESAFTGLAAHELRTPLATLRVLAEAAKDARDEPKRNRLLEELVTSADRCTRLQNQLLTLSRVDAVHTADLTDPVDMTEVVMEAVSDLLPEARSRQTKLVSHLDGSAIDGHRFGVLTMVRNLLSNAVRYTPSGGRIEVSTATEMGHVTVLVDDSGPGIPMADRERVFGRFERLHRDQESGVGLGLSIVRTVAEAHGATVTLHESPLGGLRVMVKFIGRAIAQPDSIEQAAAANGTRHGATASGRLNPSLP